MANPPASAALQGRIKVLLPLPLAGPLDYAASEADAAPGTIVLVPLGRRTVGGVVWDPAPDTGSQPDAGYPIEKLKPILARADAPPIPAVTRRFVNWVAGYTLNPPGAILRMVIPILDALQPEAPIVRWRRVDGVDLRPTPGRLRVMTLLADGRAMDAAAIAAEAAVSPAVVRGLIDLGALAPVAVARADPAGPDATLAGPDLSPDQRAAADALIHRVGAGFQATHLAGVTGSGKTEVYFEAIARVLATGGQALVLLPEIALSAQWLGRFQERFGAPPTLWHSELGPNRRRRAWRAAAEGRARVVVGARSALFLPLPDLRLIVVDEEHDGAFKQEDGVLYHARDMAVARASLGRVPIILVSATPSLETEINVRTGRYARVDLPDRHGVAVEPVIGAVDLRAHPPPRGRFLAPPLVAAVAETLASGDQAMLFLNRRGWAPLTLCRACGHRFQCPNCTAWLVEHRLRRRLVCHHCGHGEPVPPSCPKCGADDALIACGPGVERVAEEAAALFPDARIALAASDMMGGATAARELVRRMEAREIDLLVGTQMIAKGFHFPGLTLVGVVDADLGLSGGDLRAGERTWQLLHQVAGRAGRADRPGRVLLQTAQPTHPVLQALVAGDRRRFLDVEAEERDRAGMPPFGRLVALIVSGADEAATDLVARDLARVAPRGPGVSVLGPAPAPLALLRGRHRRRLLLKAARGVTVQPIVRDWLARLPPRPGTPVRIAVDVDPYGFM